MLEESTRGSSEITGNKSPDVKETHCNLDCPLQKLLLNAGFDVDLKQQPSHPAILAGDPIKQGI